MLPSEVRCAIPTTSVGAASKQYTAHHKAKGSSRLESLPSVNVWPLVLTSKTDGVVQSLHDAVSHRLQHELFISNVSHIATALATAETWAGPAGPPHSHDLIGSDTPSSGSCYE